MQTTEPEHIIAIGASAGGMEEINTFFEHTPLDGVAYVVVQHLSPDFTSRMVELLSKHSKLEVKEATENMEVKSNKVYLIPNNKFMTISDDCLHLTDKEFKKGPHLTVNEFFNSLAANSGSKAIGIVLSGLGADGAEGVRAIKKAGGMVMARNPETSGFGSMPSNAIATGIVDFVLEPAEMPGAIEIYVKQEANTQKEDEEEVKNIASILALVKEISPLDFTDYKPTTIARRIKRRAASHNFEKLSRYFEFLKANHDEVVALTQDFLISVTSFFRDNDAFDFIAKSVIPGIIKKLNPGDEIKMWVAGCATGEEAYSLAIILAEQLQGALKNTIVKIFATDIDTAALSFAGKGLYGPGIIKNVSAERLKKYFIAEGDQYKINTEVRKMVIFAQHDLVKNPPYCNMHFISCRNLLIYMTPVLQKKIYLMLLFGLKAEGYLFLGPSENPVPIETNLEVVNKKWKIYKNIETSRFVRFDAFSLPIIADRKIPTANTYQQNSAAGSNKSLTDAVNDALLQDLDCLVICVDSNSQVLNFFGDTTKYLLQKNFNSNLAELLPRPLAIAFNTLSAGALKTNKKTTANGIKIKKGDSVIKVSMSVKPLNVKQHSQQLLMVTFKEDAEAAGSKTEDIVFDEKVYLDQYTSNLEEQLTDLKEKLQTAWLQLDASNENMQSFNEELLSANEEMQSTNEEMQSVNEELHTINAEYHAKNKELVDINDDLNNYFRSNTNGQLFVNKNLQLMKFSPGTVKQINLLPTDVGRPLSNISTKIKFETLEADIKKVVADGITITKLVETDNSKWYQVMTMPYIQADEKKTGAIITFNDVTELKEAQLELDKKNEILLRINADMDNFIYTVSHDLLSPLTNIEVSIGVLNKVEAANEKSKKILDVINSSVKKFRLLIKEVASIAKIESESGSKEMVNIDDLIKNIEWSLEEQIKGSKAVINIELEVHEIYFSRKNIRSILFNLVANAIKYRGIAAPVITVSTKKTASGIVLSVKDNGMGMAEENLSRIFDMYGRLGREVDGSGIGLYLVKKIVDTAGGKIEVESIEGQGSSFFVHFNN